LLFIPALEFFSAFVFNFVIFLSSGMNDYSYLYHIFSVLFLYVFLGGIIPILLGVFFAQKTKRIVSYALMALIIFLVSSTSDFIPGGLSQVTKINFWEAKYFLAYILPNDLEWYINHDYGMYAEIYRWNLIIFWISLLSFLFFKLCQIKKTALKAVLLSLTLLISTFNLVGYFYGGSHIEKGAQLDSISMSDYLFYTENEQKNQEPDFEVTSYDMDLSIYRQLDAEVSMTLSDTGLEYYNFTLYHGYNVLKITDIEGNALKYNREGDYVTVIGNGNLQLIYSFELDKDGNIKMTRLIDISGSAISEEEKLSKISNYQKPEEKIDQNYGIETQIVTGGNGAYTQTYTDLLINSKNCDTLLEVYFERVKKGKDYTKWYAEARTIIDPTYNKNQLQYACIALGSRNSLDIYSRVNNPNNDDEIVTNFSPKNANNKSSYTVGISADLGTDPKLGVDYQTQIDIQDCEIKVAGGNKYKIWGYCYKSNSALAKGSSEQMGAVIMKNTKSTFNAMVQVGVITDYTNKNQTVNKVGWNVAVDNIRLWTNRHIFTDIK